MGEVERRVVSQILTMMDGLKSRGKVIVIGATNRINSLDPALRRPGRFDREIAINVPRKEGRLSVLKIHTRGMPLTKNVNLNELASITHGFVGADLEALSKEAAMNVLRKHLHKIKLDEEQIPQEILEKLVVKQQDFMDALKIVRPSAMREVLVETPNVDWESIGGLNNIKQELKEAVEWPMKYPGSFSRMGIRPSRGILLYGPPGTGKTLLAKAVAKESEANFIQVKGPELMSMWVGESEKGVRKIFERARQVAPCIIFFDEIDSLAGKRGIDAGTKVTERILNQLLAEMDGLEDLNDILIIGATNRPDMLDPALLRPGRFDKILLVNAPEEIGRLNILKIHTEKMPLTKEVNLKDFAKRTNGYTGADIEAVVREAAILSLRESIDSKEVRKKHFDEALKKIKPSVTKPTIEVYKKVEENYLKSAKAAVPQGSSYLG
jgi:transitional endoplasmic reticulum ATPase